MNKLQYIKPELFEEFIEFEDICGGVSVLTNDNNDDTKITLPGIGIKNN